MSDFMQFGNIVAIDEEWYMDKETGQKFRFGEDGSPVDENGNPIKKKETNNDGIVTE